MSRYNIIWLSLIILIGIISVPVISDDIPPSMTAIHIREVNRDGTFIQVHMLDAPRPLLEHNERIYFILLLGYSDLWNGVLVTSSNSQEKFLSYLFNDPYTGPYNWNIGDPTNFEAIGGVFNFYFIEYSPYSNNANPTIRVYSFLSSIGHYEFLDDFQNLFLQIPADALFTDTTTIQTTTVSRSETIPGFEVVFCFLSIGILRRKKQ